MEVIRLQYNRVHVNWVRLILPVESRRFQDKNGEPIASEAQLLDCWNEFLREKFAKPISDEHQPVEHTIPAEDVLETSELEEALKLSLIHI